MKFKIAGLRIKEQPSKFGGTWKIASVKLDGQGDEKFELQGYGSKAIENLKEGSYINGYFGEKEWNGNITKTLNKITAEYLYDIMVANNLTMSVPPVAPAAPTPEDESQEDSW